MKYSIRSFCVWLLRFWIFMMIYKRWIINECPFDFIRSLTSLCARTTYFDLSRIKFAHVCIWYANNQFTNAQTTSHWYSSCKPFRVNKSAIVSIAPYIQPLAARHHCGICSSGITFHLLSRRCINPWFKIK